MSKYVPELGQFAFGNPTSEYALPEYAESMVGTVLQEYARVFWNNNQVQFNATYGYAEGEGELKVPGLKIYPYYWGDEEAEAMKPNLSFSGVEVRWYKYFGRGMTTNVDWDANEWSKWMTKALEAIRKEDTQ